MTTYSEPADQAKGIVRFNLADGTASRFAATFEPIDLTVGRDGLVYALDSFRTINAYDPQTMTLQRTLTLPTYINGNAQFYGSLAVSAAGELFVATSSGDAVYRFSPGGALLTASPSPAGRQRLFRFAVRHRPVRRRPAGGHRHHQRPCRPDDGWLHRHLVYFVAGTHPAPCSSPTGPTRARRRRVRSASMTCPWSRATVAPPPPRSPSRSRPPAARP